MSGCESRGSHGPHGVAIRGDHEVRQRVAMRGRGSSYTVWVTLGGR